MKRFLVWKNRLLLVGALLGFGVSAAVSQEGFILGPVQEVALIEDFTSDRANLWEPRSGQNVAFTVRSGVELPGVASTLMAIEIGRKNLSDKEAGHNWMATSRDDFAPGAIPSDIDGFRFLLGSHREVQWWISCDIKTASGQSFSHRLADHTFPAGRILDYTVPLGAFKSRDGKALRREDVPSIRGLAFAFSSPGTTIYLDRIAAYRQQKFYSWLDFTTSHPANNLFQRDEPVEIRFAVGGELPPAATGFRYEIREFSKRVTSRGTVPLTQARTYTRAATPATHGYYEVSAFWVDAEGKDLQEHSCIRAEGTVPAGIGTFSVVPSTLAENSERSRQLGSHAYFGMHGDFHGLADHIGLTWRFNYQKWPWLEMQPPDRSSGVAPWARAMMQSAPLPEYRQHILPFRGNMGAEVPAWAKGTEGKAPPFKRWEDYLAMVRDSVKVEKHLYPHMKPRIYGAAWEINLNMPPYVSQPPEHTPQDVVELMRRTREVVKAEDPEGMLIGPCPSVINVEWFEQVFKAGVLQHLDGIETHGYLERVFNPEEADFPGKIARLNALMRQYNGGKVLPIYCTEAGQPGVLGAQIAHHSQALRMVREAIILKGEGVSVFLPFYGIDYDRGEYWGFFFNQEVDKNPWNTKRVSPKPMVNTVAACVQMLEGTTPRTRLRTLGEDVWAYVFDKMDKREGTVTVVWTVGAARTIKLPVESARQVQVVDALGHAKRQPVEGNAIPLQIDDAPQYVIAP